MKKGPHPVLYDMSGTERITALDFGGIRPGYSSQEIIVWLWNKKDFNNAPKMIDVRVNAIGVNNFGQSVIDSDSVKIKSNGVRDPDGVGIVDDEETQYYTLGGELTDSETYHEIGDIPSNCARRLFVKVDLPEGLIEEE